MLDPWRRQWHPIPVLLPGKSHGQRSLVGCSPWGRKESYTTEQLHFHFSFSCIGKGNGNPLHCSYLENLRDGRAQRAAIYGVAQSQTRLTRFSSSSSSEYLEKLLSSFTPCGNVKRKEKTLEIKLFQKTFRYFLEWLSIVTASQFHSKAITKEMIICPHKNFYMKVWCLIVLVAQLCLTLYDSMN